MTLVNDEKKIKVLLKECSLAELDELIAKLKHERRQIAAILAEQEKIAQKESVQTEKVIDKVLSFAKALNEQNKSSRDFEFFIELKKRKFSRPAKYQYTTESGAKKTWAGVGRKPKQIEKALNDGARLEEFLIK